MIKDTQDSSSIEGRDMSHDGTSGPPSEDILLEFKNLTYSVPKASFWDRFKCKSQKKDKQKRETESDGGVPSQKQSVAHHNVIIENMSGRILPGEIVAIIGSSGSGKTVLLDMIAGRLGQKGIVTGSITLNQHGFSNAWRALIGYAEQKEAFYPLLTVQETLSTSAKLRLPSKEQKQEMVDNVIHALGLFHARNNCVGEGGTSRISGGERRRVNVGFELVSNPRVLLLDEPTTGLDSFTAYLLIGFLKRLSREGRKCLLLTIHQPGYEILELFDRIFLLAAGKIVFQGTVQEAVHHFESLGFHIPSKTNPADFFLDILTLDARNEKLLKQSRERIATFQRAWEVIENASANTVEFQYRASSLQLTDPTPESLQRIQTRTLSVPLSRKRALETHYPVNDLMEKYEKEKDIWNASLRHELFILFVRNWKEKVRDRKLIYLEIFQILTFIVIIGLVFIDLDHSQLDIQNYTGAIFFYVINIIFTVISPALNVFPNEAFIIRKERASRMYRTMSAYYAKFASEIIFSYISNAIYASAIYWIVGFQPNAGLFFFFILISFTFIFSIQSLGFAIGSVSRNADMAQIIGSTLVVIFLIYGGSLLFPESIPGVLVWIFWLNPVQFTFKALIQNEFQGMTFECTPLGDISGCIQSGDDVVHFYALDNPDKWICFILLLVISWILQLVGYIGLHFSTAPRKLELTPSSTSEPLKDIV